MKSINIINTRRTFIAINLDSEIKRCLTDIQKEINLFKSNLELRTKFVEKDNLHISLKFLGDLNDEQIEKTISLLKKVSAENQHFSISLAKNIGSFPDFTRPRVIWAGIEKGSNLISRLYFSIENIMKSESFYQQEMKFALHITLARIKYIRKPKRLKDFVENILIEDVSQQIKTIELMESQLCKDGPKYSIIHSFPLAI